MEKGDMTLLDVDKDALCKVKDIAAGFKATQRLSGMGITPGVIIRKLSEAPLKGPVQVSVRGTRLALGRGLAKKIIIEPVENE